MNMKFAAASNQPLPMLLQELSKSSLTAQQQVLQRPHNCSQVLFTTAGTAKLTCCVRWGAESATSLQQLLSVTGFVKVS